MDIVVSAHRMPKIGETFTGKEIHYVPGGKGANQAVCCAKLGTSVVMLGAVGSDSFGSQMISQLNDIGVNTDHVLALDTPTGTAMILHTPEDNCIVIIPGANGEYTPEKLKPYEQHIMQAKVMLVQLEVPLSVVERSLQVARSSNVTTILNPAPANQLSKDLLMLADYLTPNETELEILCGQSFSSDDQLQDLLLRWEQDYRHKVIVTRGAKGCSYLNNGKLSTIAPPLVDVVDTTGAGDAFNGALAYGLSKECPLEEAIQFAVKVSSLSVNRFGAQAGMPTLEEVQTMKTPSL